VLGRVHTGIEQQVQAIDKVLRQLEDELEKSLSTQQQGELLAQWVRAREHRDATLVVLDQGSMAGCQDIATPSQHCHDKISTVKEMVDAFSKLKTQHDEMHQIEQRIAAVQPDRDWSPFAESLQQLRQQRVQRPRILCSHAVSCRSGQGLSMLRRGLTALMEDTLLFAHVGAKVPLNYSMLERLAHEGRAVASEGPENDEKAIQADRADWEQAVIKHMLTQESTGHGTVCSQTCVSLVALEEVAVEIGMDKAEVHSACCSCMPRGQFCTMAQTRAAAATRCRAQYLCSRSLSLTLSVMLFVSPMPLMSMMRSAFRMCGSDRV